MFLRYAGYKYSVHMEAEGNSYKMKLRHHDFAEYIPNGALHLSYGERNAFALVLFMYACLTKNPELNPHKYDFIPEHIVQECNLILEAR